MKKIIGTIGIVCCLLAAGFCLVGCGDGLDIQHAFPFTVETMPVQNKIQKNETAEIRCELKSEGDYQGAEYTIRYFQPEGRGSLRMDTIVFKPNDRYPLEKGKFRLYYTSATGEESQTIDIYVEDNQNQMVHFSFDFNNDNREEEKDE